MANAVSGSAEDAEVAWNPRRRARQQASGVVGPIPHGV
jgi:hypothetical protein